MEKKASEKNPKLRVKKRCGPGRDGSEKNHAQNPARDPEGQRTGGERGRERGKQRFKSDGRGKTVFIPKGRGQRKTKSKVKKKGEP